MTPFIYDMNFVRQQEAKKLFTAISTFAGGGGSSTGYRLAGGDILAVNEFIPEAQRAYSINYPTTKIFPQDIRELTGEMIMNEVGINPGELDIFDGSPPCSSFSMQGIREKGWGKTKKYSDSEQRTDDLFFEFCRVLKQLQSKTFIAENVKGITLGGAKDLLGNGQRSLFGGEEETIYYMLCEAGYRVKYKVINAADFGVPQARERTIFIGVRNDLPGDHIFPKSLGGFVSSREALADLSLSPEELTTLSKRGRELKFERLWDATLPGDSFSVACKRIFGKSSWFAQTKLDPNKPSCTITTHQEVISHWEECRLMAISEVKRLSSFPDDYYCGETYSNQFERLGRAVPPLMMKAIAESVYNTILKPLKIDFINHSTDFI